MGLDDLLGRLRRLIAANVNALFESLTDPGAAIDELIGNMEAAARDARSRVKDALTEDKRAQRHREATARAVAEWTARAERAVQAGDDNLAKEALAQRATLEAQLAEVDAERERGRVEVDELGRGLRELDAKLAAVKARRETLKEVMRARARVSAAQRYDEIVTGVDVAEAEASLGEELGDRESSEATARVRQKIERLQTERDVDARLAALKQKLNKP